MRRVLLLSTTSDVQETQDLLASLGFSLGDVVVQPRTRPDPSFYLGSGKIREAKGRLPPPGDPLVSPGAPLVVVNADLRPPQLFNLEELFGVEVWDRLRLILEIFRKKAEVKEARLQVELARLRYELPFVHEALHRQLKGEHPGFMGGGEVEARTYETQLKRRTKIILGELERVKRERRVRRAGRKKGGFQLVAIAGYTNSGKSSLLNALCDSQVEADPRVFSTLQTTTRRLRKELAPHRHYGFLFTDTVGFIRNLPPWLVDAFSSTLEEVSAADAIALTVDASEPVDLMIEKIETALDVLHRTGAPKRIVLLLNKADLLNSQRRNEFIQSLSHRPFFVKHPHVFVSARTGENLQRFVSMLSETVLPSKQVRIRLDLRRPDHAVLLHWIHDHTDVLAGEDGSIRRVLTVRCALESWGPFLREVRKAKAETELAGSSGN